MYLQWILLTSLMVICNGYRILLVFPFPATSHGIFGSAFVRHLLEAGHELTYITPHPDEQKHPNLRIIDVSDNKQDFMANTMDIHKIMKKEVDLSRTTFVYFRMLSVANRTLFNPNVQRLMRDPEEQFDVVITEWMFTDVYCGFSAVFNVPYIWFIPFELNSAVLSLIDEPTSPTYSVNFESVNVPPYNFYQRIQEFWSYLSIRLIKWYFCIFEAEVYNNAFSSIVAKSGRPLPDYEEIKYNASLMFGASHYSYGQAISVPQNFVAIGGFHINNDVKPLPEDLQKILDTAKNGVIYFSMGSNLKSKDMPEEMKRDLLNMLGELKYTVIWKFEEDSKNVPANVHLVKWAPQQSILAHPNCILFVTHGGLLSSTESTHFGKPIIGIPVFADQFININKAVRNGFAKRVDIAFDMAADLKVAINEILSDPSYTNRAKEFSFIYHDRVIPPGKELVHWVEHVVRTRGAPHLRSPALMVPWYQKMYLDVAAVIIILCSVIYVSIKRILKIYLTSYDKIKKNM